MLMCFFETGPGPLNQFIFFRVCFSGFIFSSPLFVAESASVGQHREAGKVITETGGRLPDSSGNWYVFCFGLGFWKKWGSVGAGWGWRWGGSR